MQAWLTWRPTRDTSVQSFVRCRRARALMLRYLNNTGDRRVTVFPPALRYSLQRHLAIGKGDNLVRQAQEIAMKVYALSFRSHTEAGLIIGVFNNTHLSSRRRGRDAKGVEGPGAESAEEVRNGEWCFSLQPTGEPRPQKQFWLTVEPRKVIKSCLLYTSPSPRDS